MSKLDTKLKNNKNLDRKGNSKGFNKGQTPDTFGFDGGQGNGVPVGYKNQIGGTPDGNGDKNRIVNKKLVTPKEPSLNAVAMPNKKSREVNRGVLTVKHDGNTFKTAPTQVPVGGTPMPNTIK